MRRLSVVLALGLVAMACGGGSGCRLVVRGLGRERPRAAGRRWP